MNINTHKKKKKEKKKIGSILNINVNIVDEIFFLPKSGNNDSKCAKQQNEHDYLVFCFGNKGFLELLTRLGEEMLYNLHIMTSDTGLILQ